MTADIEAVLERLQWVVQHAARVLGNPSGSDERLSALQRGWWREQGVLRERSRPRFPEPERWVWTDRSLSQASDWWSAQFKAQYFMAGDGVAGDGVVDACCGAGADAVALALRGCRVVAVDADPSLTLLAEANARLHGTSLQTIAQPLSRELIQRLAGECRGIHIDPDRRPGERKTLEADAFSPTITEVLEACQHFQTAVVKVAPATRFAENLQSEIDRDFQRVWLGSRGECRQQLLVGGQASRGETGRQAVLLKGCDEFGWQADTVSEHSLRRATVPMTNALPELANHPGRYVYDLHAVLHAAELQTAWGKVHELTALDDPAGYYTGDAWCANPGWCQGFEVLDVLAWDDRQVRRWLRSVGAGEVEVKCRLAKLDANAFQRRYRNADGAAAVCLLVTRISGRIRAIAARRIKAENSHCG